MNAVEFIKKFGWNDARVCILNCASPADKWFIHCGVLISDKDFDDLKRYVDAYELVESYGGLSYVNFALIHGDLMRTEGLDEAIALVEEI